MLKEGSFHVSLFIRVHADSPPQEHEWQEGDSGPQPSTLPLGVPLECRHRTELSFTLNVLLHLPSVTVLGLPHILLSSRPVRPPASRSPLLQPCSPHSYLCLSFFLGSRMLATSPHVFATLSHSSVLEEPHTPFLLTASLLGWFCQNPAKAVQHWGSEVARGIEESQVGSPGTEFPQPRLSNAIKFSKKLQPTLTRHQASM